MHFITSRLQLLVGLFLVCLSVSCIRDGEPSVSSATLEVGEQVPEFTVVLNSGESLANTDLKGRVSVLVFFRTACPDCREELPQIQRLYDAFRNDTRVGIYCFSWKDHQEEVEQYWQTEGFNLPYAAECEDAVYERFACRVVPTVFISDEKQLVRYKFGDHPVATFDELLQAVNACLQ